MKRPKNIFVLLDYPVFWLKKNCVWIPAFAGMTGGSFNQADFSSSRHSCESRNPVL